MSNYLNPEQWLEVFDAIAPYVNDTDNRRHVIRTFLPDMLDTGYSGIQSLELFKQSNLGIRTSEFYDIRRSILDDTNLVSQLRQLDPDSPLSESMLRISSRELDKKYRLVAAYAIENTDTQEVRYGEWAYDTSVLGTKEEILEQILEDIRARYPQSSIDTLTANLRRGYIDLTK